MQDRSIDLLRLLNRPERSPREPRRRVAGLVVAVAVLCSAGEAVLRVAPRLLPTQHQLELQRERSRVPSVPDPLIAARSAPSLDQRVYTPEFEYRLETDAQGFPNRERPARVDAVLLGSSLVTGPGVGLDLQFWTQLAREFPQAGFLNLGMPGASPAQQYQIWREQGAVLQPRLVVSVLWVAGDVEDAVHFEQWRGGGAVADYAVLRGDRPSGMLARLGEAVSQSYLLRGGLYALEGFGRSLPFAEQVEASGGEVLLLSLERQAALARGVERPELPQPAALVPGPLQQLAREVREAGGAFLLVLLPSKEEVYGAARAPAVLNRIEAVRQWLLAMGVPVLDLYPALAGAQGGALFFAADEALSPLGNDVVAEQLASWLRQSGALGTAASAASAGSAPPPQP